MATIRTILLTIAAVAIPAAASAQMASEATSGGPSLLWVWGWILAFGVVIFIVGTSLAVRGHR